MGSEIPAAKSPPKVTDVRNWFTFSASEKWTETGEELEHFTDSGGKSCGQKEKLAYAILAAALAFQFGLSAGQGAGRNAQVSMANSLCPRAASKNARWWP